MSFEVLFERLRGNTVSSNFMTFQHLKIFSLQLFGTLVVTYDCVSDSTRSVHFISGDPDSALCERNIILFYTHIVVFLRTPTLHIGHTS